MLKFLETSRQDTNDLVKNIEEFKITANSRLGEIQQEQLYSSDAPFTNTYEGNRRSSMFLTLANRGAILSLASYTTNYRLLVLLLAKL